MYCMTYVDNIALKASYLSAKVSKKTEVMVVTLPNVPPVMSSGMEAAEMPPKQTLIEGNNNDPRPESEQMYEREIS